MKACIWARSKRGEWPSLADGALIEYSDGSLSELVGERQFETLPNTGDEISLVVLQGHVKPRWWRKVVRRRRLAKVVLVTHRLDQGLFRRKLGITLDVEWIAGER